MQHTRVFTIAAVVVAVLVIAWFAGGGFSAPETDDGRGAAVEVNRTAAGGAEPELFELLEPVADRASTPETAEAPEVDQAAAVAINPANDADADADAAPAAPLPEQAPLPAAPREQDEVWPVYSCTLTVRCETILSNLERLNQDKVELVPADGVLFPTTTVVFYEGESAFNLLQREMKGAGVHLAFRNTPIYQAAYIEAINNIYEMDCGALSGWMYRVNGAFPSYACSSYLLQEGDAVEFLYSCDLGRDVGGAAAAEGQAE